MRHHLRAALGAALTVGTIASGLAASVAPAVATTSATVEPASWARVDSRTVDKTIRTGDALVGAFRDADGRHHIAKSYFTFDLTGYHGRDVLTAGFIAPQLAVADCERPVAVELWQTSLAQSPTWRRQPAELTRFGNPNQIGCPTGQLGWDVSAAIADAVAAGTPSITLGLRVSGAHQGDVAYGRTFGTPYLRLTYNTPPDVPTALRVDHHDCAKPDIVYAPGFDIGVPLSGTATDPDGGYGLTARVQVWNTAAPTDVYEATPSVHSGQFTLYYPDSLTTDGTYQWRARTEDGDGSVSAWTPPCTFTVDRTRPSAPPTVESDYFIEDSGPPGVTGPGEFTFTANGIADVVGFRWDGIGVPSGEVRADRPGGEATVTIMPTSDGPLSISVSSFDAAGNASDRRTYRFWVASNAPTTSFRHQHYFGETVPVTLTAKQPGAVTFTYLWAGEEGQPEHAIPVGAGETASIVVQMPSTGPTAYDFTVWTTNAEGVRSQVNHERVTINDTEPRVRLSAYEVTVGETITATIDPVFLGDVETYRWRVDNGPEQVVIPAADDAAEFTYVPTAPGTYVIAVYATYPNGGFSRESWLDVYVS